MRLYLYTLFLSLAARFAPKGYTSVVILDDDETYCYAPGAAIYFATDDEIAEMEDNEVKWAHIGGRGPELDRIFDIPA